MVAHLLRLKLRLLGNSLRRSPSAVIGLVFGLLYALSLLAVALVGLVVLRLAGDLELSREVTVIGGSGLVLGWALIPVLLYGTDPTLDPSRLAVYPLPPRTLAAGLALTALLGVPGTATLLLVLGVALVWSVSVVGLLAGLVSAALGLATCVLLSRVLTTAASTLLQSRRGRERAGILVLVLLMLVAPAINGVVGSRASPETVARIADVLAWTPPGWTWAAAADLTAGRWLTGAVRLLLAAALAAVLFAVWTRQTRAAVLDPRGVSAAGAAGGGSDDGGLLDRLPASPTWAVAARALTYYRRDPRYGFPALVTTLIPALLLFPGLAGADFALLAMPASAAYFLGFNQHNSVGYDGTPFWMHVVSGVPGRADRLGRLVGPSLQAAVLLPLYTLLGAGLAGRWDMVPAQLGVAIALLLCGFGVSSMASSLRPYAVPAPGESPFATPPGSAGVSLLVQLVCAVVIVVPCLPAMVLAVLAALGRDGTAWPALAAGLVAGLLVGGVGVWLGSRWFDRRDAVLMQYLVQAR